MEEDDDDDYSGSKSAGTSCIVIKIRKCVISLYCVRDVESLMKKKQIASNTVRYCEVPGEIILHCLDYIS